MVSYFQYTRVPWYDDAYLKIDYNVLTKMLIFVLLLAGRLLQPWSVPEVLRPLYESPAVLAHKSTIAVRTTVRTCVFSYSEKNLEGMCVCVWSGFLGI